MTMNDRAAFRVGSGYDIHRLVPERKLMLCCYEVPYERGLLGHSDADAPVHALIDAILGALALGDIGQHFPDTDPAYKGISGRALLKAVLSLPELQGWQIGNLDITIIAQAPKLMPHIMAMRQALADAAGLPIEDVSIKAKTAEKLGPVGAGEAIEAHATVFMYHT